MTESVQLGIELAGIGKILADRKLAVPIYQRSYAWKDEQVRDLYNDVNDAASRRNKEYFLGSVVISDQNDGRPEIVDGQQRMATTSILLSAIRDYVFSNGEEDRAGVIEEDFLISRDRRTMEMTPKLQLNDVDHDFFLKRVLMRPDAVERREVTPTRASHKRIDKAAEVAAGHVRSIVQTSSNPTERLLEYMDHVEKNAQVIVVTVPDEANAFMIFETLNDRGLSLSVSDLLKNYLFRLAEDRIGEAQRRWASMVGALETVGEEELIVTYIRHLWSSEQGYTRSKELYSEITRKVNSRQGAIDFASRLDANARYYTALLNPNHDVWTPYGATARAHVSTLRLLRVEQNRPLLLAVLEHFPEAEVKKTLRLLVSLSVRFLVTGALGSGTLETRYSDEAEKVRNGGVSSAGDLLDDLAGVAPTDEQFRSAFALATVSKNYLARYYLGALEKQARGESDPEFVPNPNEEEVNLEHVLPENPCAAWGMGPEVARTYYKRIGNLALLRNRINVQAGNDTFSDKLPHYQNSLNKLTRRLANYTAWGPQQIDDRQKYLADLAVDTWSLR